MGFGNVAPAPVSAVCAASGPAPSRAAPPRDRARIESLPVIVLLLIKRMGRILFALERDLHLEKGGRPRRVDRVNVQAGLGPEIVDIRQYPDLGCNLIGHTADDPVQLVVADVFFLMLLRPP